MKTLIGLLLCVAGAAAQAHDYTPFPAAETDPVWGSISNSLMAHTNTHDQSSQGGFQGGAGAHSDGGASLGTGAFSAQGGAVGNAASASDGGAVGQNAKAGTGFAGGYNAIATEDGTGAGSGIDAIQLGTGGNSNAGTFQVYGNQLLDAGGNIPLERMTNALGITTNRVIAVGDTLHITNGVLRAITPAP